MNWILLWAVIAVPFFFYEGTTMQYAVKNNFGFDPITIIVTLIVLVPFVGNIVQGMRD